MAPDHGPGESGIRIVSISVLAGVLALAPSALAAPPVISGADGDAWSTPPTYVVTGGAGGTLWGWSTATQSGDSDTSPFTIRLEGLKDGRHRLVVVQYTPTLPRRFLEQSARTFVVDTTAPKAVTVTGPAVIAAGDPLPVTWTGVEKGATSTWSVVVPGSGDDDPLVQGPVDTPTPAADIAALPAGSYDVLVTQRDVAGNVSPVARLAVTVTPSAGVALAPPAAPPPAPSATPPAAPPSAVVRLPARNTGRLLPKRAATLRTLRPVLRWKRGPKGTTLYNVQLFRVRTAGARASADAVTLRKVRSVFPRATRVRTAALARGGCYVWRVWPYRAGSFTKQPLGVSHFCISRKPPARR